MGPTQLPPIISTSTITSISTSISTQVMSARDFDHLAICPVAALPINGTPSCLLSASHTLQNQLLSLKFRTWMLDSECVWGREQAGRVPFIGSGAVGRLAPHCGQMASPSSRYFNASYLSKNEWPSMEIRWRNDLSGDGGGNGGDGGDRSDGWWLSGSHVFPMGPGCLYF